MKYPFMSAIIVCLSLFCVNIVGMDHDESIVTSAITYELNGGRFGDNLLSYSRAKWLSYQYGIPLKLYPFPYSDQLKLYEQEQMLCLEDFSHIVRLSSSGNIHLKKWNENNQTIAFE